MRQITEQRQCQLSFRCDAAQRKNLLTLGYNEQKLFSLVAMWDRHEEVPFVKVPVEEECPVELIGTQNLDESFDAGPPPRPTRNLPRLIVF